MSRPPGNSFIGSKPSSTRVSMHTLQGPRTDIIIDSGSDITLISTKTLNLLEKPLKFYKKKPITLSQVTAQTSIDGFVDIPLFFNTDKGPIQMDVEAHVVKNMTAPLILGNDFADQYHLSILRDKQGTELKFGETGRALKLQNTVTDPHLDPEVKAFLTTVKVNTHRKTYKNKKKEKIQKPHFCVLKDTIIPAFSSKKTQIKVTGIQTTEPIYLKAKIFKNQYAHYKPLTVS
jgi:hypothetical protein